MEIVDINIQNMSFDLINNLPKVIEKKWQNTVDAIASMMNVEHCMMVISDNKTFNVIIKNNNSKSVFKKGAVATQQEIELFQSTFASKTLFGTNVNNINNFKSYLGIAIFKPNKQIFGIIALFSEHSDFNNSQKETLKFFKKNIEFDIQHFFEKSTTSTSEVLNASSNSLKNNHIADEKYAKVFNLNPAIIAILDFNTGNFIEVNQSFHQILGYSELDISLSNNSDSDYILLNPETRKKIISSIKKDGKCHNLETIFTSKDGRKITTLIFAEIIVVEKKKCLFIVAEDITKHKETQQKLEETIAQANQSNKEIEALLIASRIIPSSKNFTETLKFIYQSAKDIIDVECGFISLIHDTQIVPLYIDFHKNQTSSKSNQFKTLINKLQKQVFKGNIFLENQYTSEDIENENIKNVLLVPIKVDNFVVGCIGFINKPTDFARHDSHISKAFAELASISYVFTKFQHNLLAKTEELEANEFRLKKQNEALLENFYDISKLNEALIKAKKEAERNEKEFRMLFENMNTGFAYHELITDKDNTPIDYRFIEVNPMFEKLTGLKRKDIIGKTILNVLPNTEKYWISENGKVAQTGKPVWFTNFAQELGKYFETTVYSPRKGYFAVTFHDVTQRLKTEQALKENEEQLTAIFNNTPLILILVNAQRKIIKINKTALSYSKKNKTQLTGQYCGLIINCNNSDICHIDKPDNFQCKTCLIRNTIDKTFLLRKNQKDIESTQKYIYENETLEKHLIISTEYLAAFNEPLVLISFNDITEQKNVEKKILQTIIETEERERTHFAQELHDGLGPLLSNVQLYFQWLADDDDNKAFIVEKGNLSLKKAFTTLREISNHLSPHVLQNFGLGNALSNFFDDISANHTIKINLNTDTDERFSSHIETALFRVITELTNNTLKHAKASEINVNVKYKEDNSLLIDYKDNGKGFDLKKVSSSSTRYGLSNIYSRIKSINGSINIISNPGEGIYVLINIQNINPLPKTN